MVVSVSALVQGQRFDQILDRYRQGTETSFRRVFTFPVIIQLSQTQSEDDIGFETKVVRPAGAVRLLIAHARSTKMFDRSTYEMISKFGITYFVMKREGGPFQERIGIGRSPSADISVRLPGISKYHAYFTKSEQNQYFVTDAGSKNGTRVCGDAIQSGMATEVNDWNQILFGDQLYVFLTVPTFVDIVGKLAV
jgi:hypothetical protein